MGFSAETIERVRRASDLVEVAGAVVQLKRVGNNFRGLSPFKKEKTPSFYVHPDKQFFKCFSTGTGGDVFRFLMMTEGLDFPAAVRSGRDCGKFTPRWRCIGGICWIGIHRPRRPGLISTSGKSPTNGSQGLAWASPRQPGRQLWIGERKTVFRRRR
ncbi:MAG: hypothetical protein EBT75_03490 [Proteobacteria bacterium]|nr:hypothetical protein [Pseudomonadota bacterium]